MSNPYYTNAILFIPRTIIRSDDGNAQFNAIEQAFDDVHDAVLLKAGGSISGNLAVGGTLGVTGVATFTAQPILSSLTASRPVFSDGSKGLVSVDVTGTGNAVLANAPTINNLTYTGSLTGGTGAINIGSGQIVKTAGGNILLGTTTDNGQRLQIVGSSLGGSRALLRLEDNQGVGGGGRVSYISFAGTSDDTVPVQTEFGYIGAAKSNGTQGNAEGYLVGAVNTGSGLLEAFRVLSSRSFLVGATTNPPGARLVSSTAISSSPASAAWNADTSGDNIFHVFNTDVGGTQRGSIDYNRAGGLVRYNTTSDGTLKNIKSPADLDQSVALIMSIPLDEWAWKNDPEQWSQVGPIAQKLHEVFPGAVSVGGEYEIVIPATYDEEGNLLTPESTETRYRPWAVDKTAPVWHLVATCQHQQQLIQGLHDRVSALEAA